MAKIWLHNPVLESLAKRLPVRRRTDRKKPLSVGIGVDGFELLLVDLEDGVGRHQLLLGRDIFVFWDDHAEKDERRDDADPDDIREVARMYHKEGGGYVGGAKQDVDLIPVVGHPDRPTHRAVMPMVAVASARRMSSAEPSSISVWLYSRKKGMM